MIGRPSLRTVGIIAGLFVVFFFWCFPLRNLRGYVYGKVLQSTGIRIESEDLGLSLLGWPGIRLYKAAATIPFYTTGINGMPSTNYLDISAKRVTARVGLGDFFPPAPRLSLYAENLEKGGNLYVRAVPGKAATRGVFEADKVALSQLASAFLTEPVEGTLNAEGNFHYDTQDLAKSTGIATLFIRSLKIPGMNYEGIVLPEIIWDEVKAKLEAKNGTLDIVECRFGTPKANLRGTLTGSVRLGRDLPSSHFTIVLKMQMTDQYKSDPQSATLVSFLQSFESSTSPGEYALKWNTSYAEILTNMTLALPVKAE
jgi:type II secretion system protein N